MPDLTWQERLARELYSLRLRVGKLQTYVLTRPFHELPGEDKADLEEQLGHMERYLTVLKRRAKRAGL